MYANDEIGYFLDIAALNLRTHGSNHSRDRRGTRHELTGVQSNSEEDGKHRDTNLIVAPGQLFQALVRKFVSPDCRVAQDGSPATAVSIKISDANSQGTAM